MVDCRECRSNYAEFEECECDGCIHSEELSDNFDQLSLEEIKKYRREERKKESTKLSGKVIEVNLSEVVLSSFETALKFAADIENPRMHSVYFGTDCIMACDTHRLLRIQCDLPAEIQNKFVLDIEDNKVKTTVYKKHPATNGQYEEVLNKPLKTLKTTKEKLLKKIKPQGDIEGRYVDYKLGGTKVVLQKKYSDDALELFQDGEEITVGYSTEIDPIVLRNDSVTIVTLPIKMN